MRRMLSTTLPTLLLHVLCLVPPAAAQVEVVEYYHHDALGSVRAVTNAAGQVVSQHDYLPFGEEWQAPLTGTPLLQFTGKERDRETGLDYFGARYYASQTGRFTTTDPFLDVEKSLIEPQRWNRYAYALNNPLKFTDPDGKNPVLVVGGVIWGLYEIGSSIYDAYATYRTVRDPNASTTDKLTTGGLFVAGMLPGVPGGGATAMRHADDLADVASFTDRNFRRNVARVLGDAPSAAAEGHHVFPQAGEFARNFSRAGIDVHDPKFGAWWTRPNHQQKAKEYNDRWRQFFSTTRNPTRDQILDYGRQLAKEYGLETVF